MLNEAELRRCAAEIDVLILDVDGVMTDGSLHYDADGREFKTFDVRDGYGIKALQHAGIEVAVISGRPSRAAAGRMAELAITHFTLGCHDKGAVLEALLATLGLPASRAACLADDLPDVPLLTRVALPIVVADCHESVLPLAQWRTRAGGGRGAVREVADMLLAARARA